MTKYTHTLPESATPEEIDAYLQRLLDLELQTHGAGLFKALDSFTKETENEYRIQTT